jgi:putative DNA primase/helicase
MINMSEQKEEITKKKVRVLNPKTANNVVADDLTTSPAFKQALVYFESYDAFFYWTDNRYFRKLSQREMEQVVLRFCETNYPRQGFTASQMKDIIALIKLKVLREAQREDTHLIAFNDCLYNTRTFTTIPSSIEHLVTWNLPYNIADLDQPTPIFQKFLETSLVEQKDHNTPDFELINLVQEMMGYFISDTFYATGAFFFYGTGSNGKSVMMDLLAKIFGKEYVSTLALADFHRAFAIGDLINKRINISREEDEKFVSAKMFKTLVTGEPVRGEHKFGAGYTMEPTCKFLLGTNKLPTFDGFDHGLKRRIFLIPFYRQFIPKEQDKHLVEKLTIEIPGIIGWALKGAKRLQENNYVFSASKASADVFAEFEEEMSSAIMFFNENYVINNNERTSKADLYSYYGDWCRNNGKKGVSSSRKFHKELIENIPGLDGEVYGHATGSNTSFRAYNCIQSRRDERVGDDEFPIDDNIIEDPEEIKKMLPGLYDAK